MFKDGEVSEIYASHILEHFSHTETLKVLKEWRRTLKKGGKCYIAVPDFECIARLYPKIGLTDFMVNLMYGDQGYALAYHYTIFTAPRLMGLCSNAGFDDVKKIKEMPYGLNDCSTLVDTIERQPISVFVEATA